MFANEFVKLINLVYCCTKETIIRQTVLTFNLSAAEILTSPIKLVTEDIRDYNNCYVHILTVIPVFCRSNSTVVFCLSYIPLNSVHIEYTCDMFTKDTGVRDKQSLVFELLAQFT